MDPPKGSTIYTIGVLIFRIGGSTFRSSQGSRFGFTRNVDRSSSWHAGTPLPRNLRQADMNKLLGSMVHAMTVLLLTRRVQSTQIWSIFGFSIRNRNSVGGVCFRFGSLNPQGKVIYPS